MNDRLGDTVGGLYGTITYTISQTDTVFGLHCVLCRLLRSQLALQFILGTSITFNPKLENGIHLH